MTINENKRTFSIHCSIGAKNTNFEPELVFESQLCHLYQLCNLFELNHFHGFNMNAIERNSRSESYLSIYVGQLKCLSNIFKVKRIFSPKPAFHYNFSILTPFSKSLRFQILAKPSLNILFPLSFHISPQTTKLCVHISSGDL